MNENIEDDDSYEFTNTEKKIIDKMYYRMCHQIESNQFPFKC